MKIKTIIVCSTLLMLGCSNAPQPAYQQTAKTDAGGSPQVTPTATLRVSADKKTVKEGEPVRISPGSAVQLEVEVVRKDGSTAEVTNDAKTRYFSSAPTVLTAGAGGRITAAEGAGRGEPSLGAVSIVYGKPGDADIGATSVVFQIQPPSPSGQVLKLTASRTELGIGESANIKVIRKLSDGSVEDITNNPATRYITTSESHLIPEPGGKVTCISTSNRPTDNAIITAFFSNFSDKLEFDLRQRGPGPSLKVEVEKAMLQEGERAKFSIRSVKDGRDLTARASGTSYLVFGGVGVPEENLLSIDDATGSITAAGSLGQYNRRSVVVFVRNGDLVGWTELKLVHGSGKTSSKDHDH